MYNIEFLEKKRNLQGRLPARVSGVLLAMLGLMTGCVSVPSPVRDSRAEAPASLDALFSEYDGLERAGASAVVIHEGRAVWTGAYGLAELETRTPATPETQYRLASLTKQFTAMAVLLLVGEGRLRYEDRLVDVLPGLPAALGAVRVEHLLHHTSGVWDYEAFVPETQREQVKDRDVPGLLARAGGTYFPPGSAVRYSNSGYALLALVVERVGGMPFARFLKERIFTPLGMHAAVAHEEGRSTVARRALGYVAGAGGFQPRDQSPTSAVLGDGGVYASVAELVAWDAALDTHALIPADTQRLAWTAPLLPDGTSTHYGFGWFVDEDEGRPRLSHHGETCGFTNAIVKYPEQRLTVIVLTNRAGGEPWRLAQRLADRWLPPAAGPRAPVEARPWPFEGMPHAR